MPKHCETVLYAEDNWDVPNILKVLGKHDSIKKYVIALHDQDVLADGTPAKPHFHIYLNFGTTNVQLPQVAKWFGVKEQSVEKIKSDKSDRNQSMGMYYTIKYYTHQDEPGKHVYPLSSFTANFDLEQAQKTGTEKLKKREQGRASKQEVEEICNKCADGTITPDNFHEYVRPTLYVDIKTKMERAWQYYDQDFQRKTEGTRDCVTIYAYGQSGTGKSTICRLYAKELGLTVYKATCGKDCFDEYQDEQSVILDDLRPYEPFSHLQLLDLTDPHYLSKAQARYKNKILKNSFVFITSVLSPQALWNGFGLSAIDSSVQFYRRIAELWEVTKDTIYIYKYMNGEFQLTGTAPNPVPEYIRQQKPSRSETLQSSGIFQKIHTEYKQMGSQQTPSANRTLNSPLRAEKPGVDDDDDIDLGISEIPIESLEYLDIEQETPF